MEELRKEINAKFNALYVEMNHRFDKLRREINIKFDELYRLPATALTQKRRES